jgi:hypothetical protein
MLELRVEISLGGDGTWMSARGGQCLKRTMERKGKVESKAPYDYFLSHPLIDF